MSSNRPHLFHGSLDCVPILKFLAPVDCMEKYVIQIHRGIVYKIVTPSSDFRGINATFAKNPSYEKNLHRLLDKPKWNTSCSKSTFLSTKTH